MEELARAKKLFEQGKGPIKIVTNFDADGLASASLMMRLCILQEKHAVLSTLPQLSEEAVQQLSSEPYVSFVFLHVGCKKLSFIKEHFKKKNVLIIDRHTPETEDFFEHSIVVLHDPAISTSCTTWRFASEVNSSLQDMAHIAVVGSVGFPPLPPSTDTVAHAMEKKTLFIENDLALFDTRTLHKSLEYSTEFFIPGVTGNEQGAIDFLQKLAISPKQGSLWRKYSELTKDEKSALSEAIASSLGVQKESLLVPRYTILKENPGPTRDAHEFASLLTSCARMEQASLAIATCLGDKSLREKAMETELSFRREIARALQWFLDNRDKEEAVEVGKGYIIVKAQENILHTIIGSVASMIAARKDLQDCIFVLATSYTPEHQLKISLRRVLGHKNIDVASILESIVKQFKSERGGYAEAAGAYLAKEKEQEMYASARRILEQHAVEDRV